MKQLIFLIGFILISFSGFAQTAKIDTAINIDTTHNPIYSTKTPPVAPSNKSDSVIVTFAEVMPTFPGPQTFQQYLMNHVKYPYDEKKKGLEGVVYVSFIIEKDGYVSNVRVVKGVPGAPGFSAEAIRVIKLMPDWNPGMMQGKPVRVEITQPIRFVLGKAKK